MLHYCGECRADNWPSGNTGSGVCDFCGVSTYVSTMPAASLPEPRSAICEIFGNMRTLYAAWYRATGR
jgi:hypothetical protein